MSSLSTCYLTRTAAYLPGPRIANDDIGLYLGELDGEEDVRQRVLKMNGIVGRHYAQDRSQNPTDDVYSMAAKAVSVLLGDDTPSVSFLSAGTTYSPFTGPGLATMLHAKLQSNNLLNHPLELSSHGGICTSAAAAMVNAVRSIQTGQHQAAVCVGSEHASEVLKSTTIQPVDDRHLHEDPRLSHWFMSVFLRFMLSDGAGAFLLQSNPPKNGLAFKVDWTHSMSFAHSTELCMKMESRTGLLSQDVDVLSRYLYTSSDTFLGEAMRRNNEVVDDYTMVLPHLSSFFFRRRMQRVIQKHVKNQDHQVPHWTNLATVGNTGSASIYVMLDQYLSDFDVADGERLLLFIPESGQFNYVMVSLTAIVR